MGIFYRLFFQRFPLEILRTVNQTDRMYYRTAYSPTSSVHKAVTGPPDFYFFKF